MTIYPVFKKSHRKQQQRTMMRHWETSKVFKTILLVCMLQDLVRLIILPSYFGWKSRRQKEQKMQNQSSIDDFMILPSLDSMKGIRSTVVSDPRSNQNVHEVPNLLLIGTQKAGTTALAQWLFQSDQVCRPKVFDNEPRYHDKEVHFFNDPNRFKKGINFYSKRYAHCSVNKYKFALDATPNTLMYPERVQQTYSDALGLRKIDRKQFDDLKFVVILREPIARELSLYNHKKRFYISAAKQRKERNITKTHEEWFDSVANEDGSIMQFHQYAKTKTYEELSQKTSLSMYEYHLKKWFGYFNRTNQILVLNYDEMKEDPNKVQWRLQSFLSLDDLSSTSTDASLERLNDNTFSAKTRLPSCYIRNKLKTKFDKYNDDLYRLLNPPSSKEDTLDEKKTKYASGPTIEQTPFPHFKVTSCYNRKTNTIQ